MSEITDRLTTALADRYRVERELGQGGMSTVYLAEDIKHHRKVAVKVLRPDLAAALGSERFLREVKIAANLSHPHILPLYDSGESDGFLYYVMPYVEGESLRAKLEREGELPIVEAVRIIKEVVDALAYAHEHGVVHRDIKPDNVMLSGRHALVTDFGVAKAVSEATGRQQLTTAGVALGTPAYMAPEQAAADPHIDHRADIYAVGALAYELLAGRPPFTGSTPQQVLSAHVSVAPEPVTAHRTAVPPTLADVVMRCLEKKPADRWQSAEELLPRLEAFVTTSGGITPVETRPVTAVRPAVGGRRVAIPAAAVAGVLVVLAGGWLLRGVVGGGDAQAAADERESIAVLPFISARTDEESEFFTAGIHDDILTQLSKISALKVISRTSVLEYKNTTKNIRQIGQELGTETVLEGRVQRAGNRVRLNVQLVDAVTDEQVWAEVYERELTMDNRFAIQADIAEQVALALEATLSSEERDRIAARPTSSDEAYEFYLRGRDYYVRSFQRSDVESAVLMLERAVALDERFAIAQAQLAMAHSFMYWLHYDRTRERLAKAKAAIDAAFGSSPGLPDAHVALGYYYYWGYLDYDRALAEFAIVERRQASDPNLFMGIASVQRRQGRTEEALPNFRRAHELDPRSLLTFSEVAGTLVLLRRYDEARLLFDSVITLFPDLPDGYRSRAWLAAQCCADIEEGLRVLDKAWNFGVRHISIAATRAWFQLAAGDYRTAIASIESVEDPPIDNQYEYWPRSLFVAEVLRAMGDSEAARVAYDSARVVLEEAVQGRPDDERLHSVLGIAYAGLGRKEDAIRAGRRGVELLPYEREAWRGASRHQQLAQIYAMVGEPDSAIAQLEFLLARPGDISPALLKIEARWNPLRDDPRFRRLVGEN